MATARMLSTTIAVDGQLARLSMLAEMMYLKVIPHLDRDGMITGDPLALLGIISPMRFSQVHAQMPALVDEWVDVELVVRFQASSGSVLFFKGFLKQQKLRYDRERPSQFPPPPGYVRTPDGLKPSTDVPWVEGKPDSGVLPKNPAKLPVLPDSAGQQQQKQQQQEEQQQEQQQQQAPAATPAAPPAAAAAPPSEAADLLAAFGVGEPSLSRLASCDPGWIRGWMWEAEQAGARIRDPVAFLIARLKARERPPLVIDAAQWADLHEDDAPDSYEALKRRYIPAGWEDIVVH